MAFKRVLTCNCIAGRWVVGLRFYFNSQTNQTQRDQRLPFSYVADRSKAVLHKQFLSGSILAEGGAVKVGSPLRRGQKFRVSRASGKETRKFWMPLRGQTLTVRPKPYPRRPRIACRVSSYNF